MALCFRSSVATTGRWRRLDRPTRIRAEPEDAPSRPQRRGELSGKTGKELRDEFFMAAQTGSERGLPDGSFLNDNTTGDELQTEITWEPYGDKNVAAQGSSILRAGVEAGAFEIGPAFCLTGQCDSCLVELDTGEAVLGCMRAIPKGRDKMTITVVATDEAWEAMLAGGSGEEAVEKPGEEDDMVFI